MYNRVRAGKRKYKIVPEAEILRPIITDFLETSRITIEVFRKKFLYYLENMGITDQGIKSRKCFALKI